MTAQGRNATPALGANYAKAPVTDDVEWQLKGLCGSGDYDPNLWYPEPPRTEQKALDAKRICRGCLVINQCRDWALLHHEHSGVWGGLSVEDRKAIWRGTARVNTHPRRRRPISA